MSNATHTRARQILCIKPGKIRVSTRPDVNASAEEDCKVKAAMVTTAMVEACATAVSVAGNCSVKPITPFNPNAQCHKLEYQEERVQPISRLVAPEDETMRDGINTNLNPPAVAADAPLSKKVRARKIRPPRPRMERHPAELPATAYARGPHHSDDALQLPGLASSGSTVSASFSTVAALAWGRHDPRTLMHAC